ncbi:MAG: hypothetical protein Q9177_001949, partial [Variospora cf. flavescens]
MPQVQVALRALAAGKTIRMNDVIAYIMTNSPTPSNEPAAKRAYAPQDVCSASSTLTPDIDWYLYKQIFPPIERLCAPLPVTDAVQLAECLGLDTKKYSIGSNNASSSYSNSQIQDISPLESQIPDEIRFKSCARLSLRCRHCKTSFVFEGLVPCLKDMDVHGIVCPNRDNCGKILSTLSVTAQLEHAVRIAAGKYYDGYLVCDDPSCGNRTRQMSVYGHRCLGPRGRAEGCLGRMRYAFGERDMYNQLLYFRNLWTVDVDAKAVKGLTEEERE